MLDYLLHLASCCAKMRPDSSGDPKLLHDLDLSDPLIGELPDSSLLVSCHHITRISDSFNKLKSLSELGISFSAINELPDSLRDMKELKDADPTSHRVPS